MSYMVAGIDVHKRVLMVSVADAAQQEMEFACRRFGTTTRRERVSGLCFPGAASRSLGRPLACCPAAACELRPPKRTIRRWPRTASNRGKAPWAGVVETRNPLRRSSPQRVKSVRNR